MIIDSFNDYVFTDVKKWLTAKFSDNRDYDHTCVVLGSAASKMTPEQYRASRPGYRIVVYNLEQLFSGSVWANQFTFDWLRKADEIWDYDIDNINYLGSFGLRARYLPLEYTDAVLFETKPPVFKDIDVLFYGAPTDRRLKILQAWMGMSQYHAKTVVITGIRDQELVNYIQRSKIILNLHAFPSQCRQEQVRMFVPVSNGCCVVSEASAHNEFGMSIIETDTKNINVTLKTLIKTGNWESFGAKAAENYKAFCAGR
jgi:hypothetical protein